MVEKQITPDSNEKIIKLPNEYIGKKTHLHIDVTDNSPKRPSDYFGTIDEETAVKFKKHLKKIKTNWE